MGLNAAPNFASPFEKVRCLDIVDVCRRHSGSAESPKVGQDFSAFWTRERRLVGATSNQSHQVEFQLLSLEEGLGLGGVLHGAGQRLS